LLPRAASYHRRERKRRRDSHHPRRFLFLLLLHHHHHLYHRRHCLLLRHLLLRHLHPVRRRRTRLSTPSHPLHLPGGRYHSHRTSSGRSRCHGFAGRRTASALAAAAFAAKTIAIAIAPATSRAWSRSSGLGRRRELSGRRRWLWSQPHDSSGRCLSPRPLRCGWCGGVVAPPPQQMATKDAGWQEGGPCPTICHT